MAVSVVTQNAAASSDIPSERDIDDWITSALMRAGQFSAQVTVRIVEEDEMRVLNRTYRQQDKPTDVLAFSYPGAAPAPDLVGDIVICAAVVNAHAATITHAPIVHWVRIAVHGALHLCGYDHCSCQQAKAMEAKEREILAWLGFEHPDLLVRSI